MSALLFTPLKLRGLSLRNRVVISPMQQHCAEDGVANDWHMVHYGKFAMGGAGLVIVESTAVGPAGMSGHDDLGLWRDDQEAALAPIVRFAHQQGAAIGLQICHAGRKAGTNTFWKGGGVLTPEQMQALSPQWERVAPSAIACAPGWSTPRELTIADLADICGQFVAAAQRADRVGFDVLELHGAHGYLLASFLSPLSNVRSDRYGGSLENRMRFPLEVVAAVRAVWPAHKPLFCRISVVDGGGDKGWREEDSVVYARALAAVGVDVVDCSSGGLSESPTQVARGLGFQVPFAERVRREAGVPVQAVGFILDGAQAEAILQAGQADLIAIGREAYDDPYWPHHAARALGAENDFAAWPLAHGAWLRKRAPLIKEIKRTI
ncbi:MAG: NADH:flavin oxidoreductase/NADH oxidase [Burkholderiaceae bacterium]|nr:NADH:flavin oxidoreductase/NADH oxidase [Burkholderiaceae bacterium]